jgi:DNA invertase Pin-like site-specific DNA recombinase
MKEDARLAGHPFEIRQEFLQQIGFQSVVEAIDTTTATGQFFFQITGAVAELERNLMRERTLAGLASARRRGRKGGRRKAIDPKTFALALQPYEARTSSVQHICTRLSIARRTFYRDLVAHRARQQERGGITIEVIDAISVPASLFRW